MANLTMLTLNDTNITNSSSKECMYRDDPYTELKLFHFSLTLLISLFGLVGNTIVIAVNTRIKKLSATDVYLTFLAITDNFMIVSINLFTNRYVYHFLSPMISDWRFSGYLTFTGYLLRYYFQCLNTSVIVLVNVDRYILIKHTSISKSWCIPRRAVCNFTLAVVGSALFTLPRMWEIIPLLLNVDVSVDKCHGYFKLTHGLAVEQIYLKVYVYALCNIILYAIPLIIMVITNFTLISTILDRRRWLASIRPGRANDDDVKQNKRDLNAIVTLCTVTITFMILQIPEMALQIIWKISWKNGPTASIFVGQLMVINFSVNFVIYSLTSKLFRKRLSNLFSVCFKSVEHIHSSTTPMKSYPKEKFQSHNTDESSRDQNN